MPFLTWIWLPQLLPNQGDCALYQADLRVAPFNVVLGHELQVINIFSYVRSPVHFTDACSSMLDRDAHFFYQNNAAWLFRSARSLSSYWHLFAWLTAVDSHCNDCCSRYAPKLVKIRMSWSAWPRFVIYHNVARNFVLWLFLIWQTLFITCSTTAIAMSGANIGLVFGLTGVAIHVLELLVRWCNDLCVCVCAGSVTCTALMFIFPGLFFFLTTRRYKKGTYTLIKTFITSLSLILSYVVQGSVYRGLDSWHW